MKALTIAIIAICLSTLTACDKSATEHNLATHSPNAANHADTTDSANADDPHDLSALAAELQADSTDSENTPDIQPIKIADGKIKIDWSYITTSEPKARLDGYQYPIALDAQAVKNYAKAYHITDKQAQHSLVVGMASPEVLGKVLDQLKEGKYLGHRLTDGADMTLVISTTPDVVADRFEYVFADNFGRGLVLPVVIEPVKR